ncbi:MAG: hypothetical protein ABI853_00100 [Sphingomicrobium sp.]
MSEEREPRYRVYILDHLGMFLSVDELDADSDEDAVAAVKTNNHDASKCELWDGHQLVAKIEL